ncbi:MAG: hypothetical protein ACXWT0_03880 [Methylobacter sp.]
MNKYWFIAALLAIAAVMQYTPEAKADAFDDPSPLVQMVIPECAPPSDRYYFNYPEPSGELENQAATVPEPLVLPLLLLALMVGLALVVYRHARGVQNKR